MDIITYRQSTGLSQEAFARLLAAAGSPATQALISMWEKGTVVVPPKRWQPIELVTEGAVTRQDLRPDLYPPNSASERAQS